jgi:putative DNA primase/helicase
MITAVAPQEMEQEYRRAMLSRSRLNVVNELPEADILNSESVKAILAGDKVVGREIREAPFSFQPRAGHLFAANTLPGVRDMTRGFWRRWIVIQFNREFQEGQQDRTIASRIIQSELPAIAAWALRGAVRVFQTGAYTIPKSSAEALKEWRTNADQIAQFLDQKCEIENADCEWMASGQLYTAYSAWTIRSGHRSMSQTKFGKRLSSLGVKKERRRSGIFWSVKVSGE